MNGSDSLAVQLVDETHWDDIVIIIAVVWIPSFYLLLDISLFYNFYCQC